MHTHRHLFERICRLDNLLAAAHDALRGKRQRGPGFRFWVELESEICNLHDELMSGEYRHGAYRYFTIHEPKDRLVAAAPFRDRVVHHAIVRVIEPLFEPRFIEDSFACRRGKGTHAAMRRARQFARRFPYALKCDVQKYFPSIDHEVLFSQLTRVIADEKLLNLLAGILGTHADGVRHEWPEGGALFDVRRRTRGLPIGNLTSQFFANVYLNPLDHFVKHEIRVKGYVRYLDDFLLFGQDRPTLRRQGEAVLAKLAELRLTMHPDKYRLVPTRCGVDFVGYAVFADGRTRVRSSSVRRFDRRYKRMQWNVKKGFQSPAKVTESVRAWVAHASHANSTKLRRSVLTGRNEEGWQG